MFVSSSLCTVCFVPYTVVYNAHQLVQLQVRFESFSVLLFQFVALSLTFRIILGHNFRWRGWDFYASAQLNTVKYIYKNLPIAL